MTTPEIVYPREVFEEEWIEFTGVCDICENPEVEEHLLKKCENIKCKNVYCDHCDIKNSCEECTEYEYKDGLCPVCLDENRFFHLTCNGIVICIICSEIRFKYQKSNLKIPHSLKPLGYCKVHDRLVITQGYSRYECDVTMDLKILEKKCEEFFLLDPISPNQ